MPPKPGGRIVETEISPWASSAQLGRRPRIIKGAVVAFTQFNGDLMVRTLGFGMEVGDRFQFPVRVRDCPKPTMHTRKSVNQHTGPGIACPPWESPGNAG